MIMGGLRHTLVKIDCFSNNRFPSKWEVVQVTITCILSSSIPDRALTTRSALQLISHQYEEKGAL